MISLRGHFCYLVVLLVANQLSKYVCVFSGMCIHIPGFLTTARGFDRFVLHVFLRSTARATLSKWVEVIEI